MRRRRRGRSFGLVGAVAVIGVACGGETPVGADPDSGRVPGAPIALAVAPTYSTALSPTTSRSGIGPIALGTYPEPTLVEIRATGTIDRYYGFVWYYYSLQGQFDRTIDAGGDYGTQYVHIAFDSPAMGWFKDTQGLPLQEEWSKTVVVQGSGRAEWVRPGTGGQCDSPGTPDCFTYTGSFQVSVTPFPAELVLKASRSAITPGQSVAFTASVAPDTVENIGVPFKVVEWRWLPDAGGEGAVLTQCANQKICSYAPSVSGTMRATGFANAAAAEAEVQVTVFPCLTGDPLLDNPRVRDGLRSSFDSLGYPHLSPADRTERGGGAFLGPNGDTLWVPVFPPGPRDDACSFWPSDHASSFPGNPIISWHGHAFDAGDELPGVDDCYRDPRLAPLGPGDKRYAGARPSSNDINEGGTVDNIIVTPSYVWLRPKYFPDDPPTTLPDSLPRAACDPLAQPIR